LCLGSAEQITRTTRLRFTTLHLRQIFFTDVLTFTFFSPFGDHLYASPAKPINRAQNCRGWTFSSANRIDETSDAPELAT
jgi:hypothetical protein